MQSNTLIPTDPIFSNTRSDSTIRFRTITELTHDLTKHDFVIEDIREAPDRPGKEHVVIARKK